MGRPPTHGMFGTREYRAWNSMKDRCLNTKHPRYKDYGGRGITICDEWKTSFEKFFKDMGYVPDGYSLERKRNNEGYYKDNCEWASAKAQANNRRTSRHGQ